MKKILFLGTLSVFPLVSSAQLTQTGSFIDRVGNLIDKLIPITIALALLVFFFGLVKFIRKAGDEKEIAAGRKLMIWGLVALFVIVTVWGLVAFIGTELGVTPTQLLRTPQVPRPGR